MKTQTIHLPRHAEIKNLNDRLVRHGLPRAVFDFHPRLLPDQPQTERDVWAVMQSGLGRNLNKKLRRVMLRHFVWAEVYDLGHPKFYYVTFRSPVDATCINGIVRAASMISRKPTLVVVRQDNYEERIDLLINSMVFKSTQVGLAHFFLDGTWKLEVLSDYITNLIRAGDGEWDNLLRGYNRKAFLFSLDVRFLKNGQTVDELRQEVMAAAQGYLFSWMKYEGIEPKNVTAK